MIDIIANVLSQRTLLRDARRAQRNESNIISFNTLGDVEFQSELIERNDECILVFDSGQDDPDRILVFSNSELQRIARNSHVFHVDGTFRVCPKPFYQLYTVH